jgi:BirA family biotin operon repressor/biotin-[acetyl-CoA-carboxylase] ligase
VSLRQLGYHVQRNELVARLLLRLNQHLHTFVVQGFAPVRRLWQSYNQHQDQLVQLLLSGETLNGVCRGVNDTGAVLVEVGGELRAFNGGEISLRPQRGVM